MYAIFTRFEVVYKSYLHKAGVVAISYLHSHQDSAQKHI